MKPFILFIFLFLLLDVVNAEEIEINPLSENYYSGTTFQSEININTFLYEEISASNVNLFFEDTRVDIVPLLKKIDDKKYFLYFKLPSDLDSGDYELLLKDVVYNSNGTLVVNSITKEIIILDKINETFYIEPGLVYFDLITTNHRVDFEILSSSDVLSNVNIDSNNEYTYISSKNLEISPGSVKTFYIEIDELINVDNENYIEVSNGDVMYLIPFYIPGQTTELVNETSGKPELVFNVGINEYRDVFVLGESLTNKEINIKNIGTAQAENIMFRLTGNLDDLISLDNRSLNSLEQDQEYSIKSNFSNAKIGEYSGKIQILVNGEIADEFLILVSVVSNQQEKEDKIEEYTNETDNSQEVEKTSNLSYVVLGFLGLILILGIIYFIYRKKITFSS